jgi:hypothetical protein
MRSDRWGRCPRPNAAVRSTESGLQGQTTSAERAVVNGHTDSELGYNCNLELVGQFRGEGPFRRMGRRTLITAPTCQRK